MARIQWQRFEWRSGADVYTYEVTDGGLFGILATAGGRAVMLIEVDDDVPEAVLDDLRKIAGVREARAITLG